MCYKTKLLLFLSVFLFQSITAQYIDTLQVSDKKFVKYLDIRFENGAMLGNGTAIGDQLVNASYYNGTDIRLGFRKTDPDDVYSNVYRRPYLGVGYYSSTFHNEAIGRPNALYFFLTMPFAFERNKKLTFSYSAAFGLAYNFNAYDSVNNPINVFLGSQNNCYVDLYFVMNYRFNDNIAMNGSLGFKHFSNGSFRQPNFGINLIPVTVGVSYRLNDQKVLLEKTHVPIYKPHNLWNITLSAGSKHYSPEEDRNYLKMGLNVNFLRQINYKYRLGVGMDFFYAAESEKRNADSFSTAVVGTWEWCLTRNLYAPIALAFYLKRNEANNEVNPYYQRVGLRYRFNNNLHAGLTIKAHAGQADYFEWAIGYTFHNDPN
jgi:hypothetical protein